MTKRQRSMSPPKGISKKKCTKANSNTMTSSAAASRDRRTAPRRKTSDVESSNRRDQHVSYKKWIKQQGHDYNTHQFLDASATVHAGLFGGRRLPEIKALWRQLVQEKVNIAVQKKSPLIAEKNDDAAEGKRENIILERRRGGGREGEAIRRPGESGGGKISSRHLRRRTNSHNPSRRYRNFTKNNGSAAAGKGENDARSKAQDVVGDIDAIIEGSKEGKPPCRRARRKPFLMKASHSTWWEPKTYAQLVQSASSIDEYTVHKWLTTHLWHAKRFHMSPKLFDGWSIPLIHCNRGSRASLRLASSETSPKCTIQDGTWEVNGCAINIEVREVLRRTAPPSAGSSLSTPTPPSSTVDTLVIILQRLVGAEAPFLNDENVLSGNLAGEGIIHETDSSPLLPVGPATFLFGCSTEINNSNDARVGILIHPATHHRVVYLLNKLVREYGNLDIEVTLSTLPLALLRIRGRASTVTVQNVLRKFEHIDFLDDDANTHNNLIDLGENPTFLETRISDLKSIPKKTTPTRSWIKLKCHQPNQNYQHLPHNLASSGWDIYCDPSICSFLLQSFVVDGGACAIGLVEDVRARLEAYPPLPIFPRDYPDTSDGRLYWNGGANLSSAKNEREDENRSCAQWQDWVVIRNCVEGSWGRINTELKKTIRHFQENKKSKNESNSMHEGDDMVPMLIINHKLLCRETISIHWESLTNVDNETAVVVRGIYGFPFLKLLHGCGKPFLQPANTIGRGSKRRPRRTVRPVNWAVCASPLSNKESELHSGLCQRLSASLSLPALLRCELYVDGKGAINVGDLIFPMDRHDNEKGSGSFECEDGAEVGSGNANSSPLGVVTGGGFSPSRGKCHGIAFVGAARLIKALDGTVHGTGLLTPQSHGHRTMSLKVMVVRDASVSRVALLSILLND
jgi:hypothetical protein